MSSPLDATSELNRIVNEPGFTFIYWLDRDKPCRGFKNWEMKDGRLRSVLRALEHERGDARHQGRPVKKQLEV